MILKLARIKGLNVIGITDHDTIKGGLIAKKLAKKIKVIQGIEIKTNVCEIIVLEINKNIKTKNIFEIIDFAKDENLVTILPHPGDFLRKGILKAFLFKKIDKSELKEILKKVNLVETFNARALPLMNFFSFSLAKRFRVLKKSIASSDSHFPLEIGKVYNYVGNDESEIWENLLKGKVKIVKKSYSPFLVNLKSFKTYLASTFLSF